MKISVNINTDAMILQMKYIFAVFIMFFSSSVFLYNITGKTECFWFILALLILGSILGIFTYAFLFYITDSLFIKYKNINKH